MIGSSVVALLGPQLRWLFAVTSFCALATSQVSEPGFAVELRSSGQSAAGRTGSLLVLLEAKAPYHVNQAYPFRFSPKPVEGLKFPVKAIDTERVKFDEHHGTFPLLFTAEKPGTFQVTGTFSFSVCSADKCLMEKRDLALTVDVK